MAANEALANKSDLELIQLTLADQENFLYLVNRYQSKLLRFIQRISGLSTDDAQDLLQEDQKLLMWYDQAQTRASDESLF